MNSVKPNNSNQHHRVGESKSSIKSCKKATE